MLGNVHVLELENNNKLVDVSALAGVYALNINGCGIIHDYSVLGNVRKLWISR